MKMKIFLVIAYCLTVEAIGAPVINVAPLIPNVIPRLTDIPFILDGSYWRDMHTKTSEATVLLGQQVPGEEGLYYTATGFFIKTHPSRDYVCLLTAAHNFGGIGLLFPQDTPQDLEDTDYQLDVTYLLRYKNDVFLNSLRPNFTSYGWKATKVKIKRLSFHPPSIDYALLHIPKNELPRINFYMHGVEFLETVEVPPGSTEPNGFYMIHHTFGRPQLISTLYGQNGGVFYNTDHFSYRSANWYGNIEEGASGAALVFPAMPQATEGAAIAIHSGRTIPNNGRIIQQFKLIRIQELIESQCLVTDEYKLPQNRRKGQFIQGSSQENLTHTVFVRKVGLYGGDRPEIGICEAAGANEIKDFSGNCKTSSVDSASRTNSTNVCDVYQAGRALSVRKSRAAPELDQATACIDQVQSDVNDIKNEIQQLIQTIKNNSQLVSNSSLASIERDWEELLRYTANIRKSPVAYIDLDKLSEYDQAVTRFINFIAYVQKALFKPTNPPNTWLPHADNWKPWFLYRTGPGFFYYTLKGKEGSASLFPVTPASRVLKELNRRLTDNQSIIRKMAKEVSSSLS